MDKGTPPKCPAVLKAIAPARAPITAAVYDLEYGVSRRVSLFSNGKKPRKRSTQRDTPSQSERVTVMPKTSFIYLVAEGDSIVPYDLLRVACIVPFRQADSMRMPANWAVYEHGHNNKRRILFRRFETIPLTRAVIIRNALQLTPTFESYGWRIVGIYTAPDVAIAVTDFPEQDGKRGTS